jgi:FKBP-type peptidyl-prolyl cis-trans isomerase FklB
MKSKTILSILLAGVIFIPSMAQKNKLFENELDSVSYSLGIVLGSSIKKAGIKVFNDKLLLQGINEVNSGQETVFTPEMANQLINAYLTKLNEKKAVTNLIEGQKFLVENSKKEGVITLPSGLQYKVINEGQGESPIDTSTVTVHYTGTLINGEVFDSSVKRGQPAQFPVNGVIPGWTEALQLMKPGAKWILYLPPQLAYGEYGTGGIEPNSVLIFDVELISVDK